MNLDGEDKEQAFWRQAHIKVLVRIFSGIYGKDDADLAPHSNALINNELNLAHRAWHLWHVENLTSHPRQKLKFTAIKLCLLSHDDIFGPTVTLAVQENIHRSWLLEAYYPFWKKLGAYEMAVALGSIQLSSVS